MSNLKFFTISKFANNLLVIFFILSIFSKSYAIENKILFKINNEIVTTIDLLQEVKYLSIINKNLNQLENQKVFGIAKNSLIREKIKEIELIKFFKKLSVEEEYYNQILLQNAKKLGLNTIKEFEGFVRENNMSIEVIQKKIIIEILWNQLIVKKYLNEVKINEENIKKNLINKKKQIEFNLREIIFNIEDKENINEKFKIIKNDIISNNFEGAALIHSISPTSQQGGNLGWIKESSLNNKIKSIIKKTDKGNFTKPIVIPGGFLILKIEDTREIELDIDLDREIKLAIKEKTNEQLNQFSNIYFNKIKKNIKIDEL